MATEHDDGDGDFSSEPGAGGLPRRRLQTTAALTFVVLVVAALIAAYFVFL